MESNKTYNVTVENDSDILVTVATVATVEISGAPVNVGTGAGISAGILNENLAFRTITTDSNITATQNALDVELSLATDLTVSTITSGNIVPTATNTYTLGTPTNVWADLYLGDASLYIDGTKVLGSDAVGDIDFTTDPGQNMNIQSGGDIVLIPTSAARIESSDVRLNLPAGTGTTTVYGQLNVAGDIVRGGTTYADRSIQFTGGNATVSTPAATYLHLDTPTVYLGSFSDFTTVSGSSITGDLIGAVTGTVSTLANHTTDNLSEGANLYYTDARVDARIPTTVGSFTNDAGYITSAAISGFATETYVDTAVTGLATETYVDQSVAGLVDSAPGTLDTLNELAAALGDDPNFATTITTSIATKLNTADFNSAFDTQLATKTTDSVAEGSNLYYTEARSRSAISVSSSNLNELSYDANTGVISYTSPTSVTAVGEVVFDVRNTSGVSIPRGAAVYLAGHSGSKILVALADANAAGEHPAIGLANSAMPHNSDGTVLISGEMLSVDTSAFSVNDVVYLSETPGVLTATRPTSATTAVQNIGKVARSDNSNGIIIVSGSGRENDVPNLAHNHVFIGNQTGVQKRQLTITDLSDVDTTTSSPNTGEALVWNATEWAPAAITVPTSVFDLSDVSVGPPGGLTQGAVLQYNSFVGEFIPAQIPAGVTTLDGLSDVQTSGAGHTPVDGSALVWDASMNHWMPGSSGATSIFDLTDVYSTTPTPGDVLQWDNASNQFLPSQISVSLNAEDLGNVTFPYGQPQAGQALVWDFGFNAFIPQAVGGGGGTLEQVATDVTYPYGMPQSGQSLVWDGGFNAFVPQTAGGGSGPLDSIATDVTYPFGPPQQGQALVWDFGFNAFVPQAVGGGGGSPLPLDNIASDVEYFNVITQQFQPPNYGEILTWGQTSTGTNAWVIAPAGGAPTTLDLHHSDVSYVIPGAPPGVPPATQVNVGDVLMWTDDSQSSGHVGWMPIASSTIGGGGGGGATGTLDQVATDVYYPSGPFGLNYMDSLNWDGSNWVPGYNFNYSDARIKTNITPITGALEKITGLTGVQFEWIDEKYRGSTIGLTAQNVEQQFPEVVHTGMHDMKQVDYGSLVGPLIEAIKEQQEQILALSARITELGG